MIKVYQLKALQNNYIVSIPFKGVKVRCEFKDGNIAKGIYARLYTNDRFKQMAIEQCELNGKMWQLVEKVKEPGDEEVTVKPAGNVAAKPAEKSTGTVATEPANISATETDDEAAVAPQQTGQDEQKVFSNLAEAILFIASTYAVQVENASQARKILKEHGINAVIKK